MVCFVRPVLLFLLFGVVSLAAGRAEAAEPKVFPKVTLSTSGATGAAAVAALGAKLPDVAAFYGKTADELRQILLSSSALHVGRSGRLYTTSPQASRGTAAPLVFQASSMPWAGGPAIPLDQTFQLHSKPDAAKTIYLNFVGKTLTAADNTYFQEHYLPTISVPPFSTDANEAVFSDAERRIIQEIWQRVAEDYAPFDVDVTTEAVPQSRITRTNADDLAYGTELLFARNTIEWDCSTCAGATPNKSFFDLVDDRGKPAIVFYTIKQTVTNGVAVQTLDPVTSDLADSASRELGYSLGLFEAGKLGVTDYYAGQGDSPVNGWVPMMGELSGKPLRQFSKGEYAGASSLDKNNLPVRGQDDFLVITESGLPLRADEAGNAIAQSAWFPVESSNGRGTASFDGVITSDKDFDVFSLRAGVGTLTAQVSPAALGPNADLMLRLLNSQGTEIQKSAPLQDLSASINFNVTTAGQYFLEVRGTGEGDPLVTGYSSYGSVGAYALTGSFATPSNNPPSAVLSVTPTSTPLMVTFDASGSSDDGQIKRYRWEFGDGTSREDATPGPLQKTFAMAGNYTVTLRVTDDTGLTTQAVPRIVTVPADTALNQPPVASFSASPLTGTAPLQVTVNGSASTDDGQISTYRWEWGDGTSQQGPSPGPFSKTYTSPGNYTITLHVTDDDNVTRSATRIVTVTAAPVPNQPPVASFSASPLTGTAPLEVTVNGSASTDDGQISTYRWEWGDGTSQQGPSPGPFSKTYTSPGNYTITLHVTDDDNVTRSATRIVTVTAAPVPNQPPVASFSASPLTGTAPLEVTVNGSASTDDGQISTYRWEWGDGTSQQGPSPGPFSKTYTSPGNYTITLHVTDDDNVTRSATRDVTVTAAPVPNQPPVASFSASPLTGTAPLDVTVNGSASTDDGQISSYRWEWGDGTSQQGPSPGPFSKTYASPGNYTITLHVTDDDNVTRSATRIVTVTAAPVPNIGPVASFSASPLTGTAPLLVKFDATGSWDDKSLTAFEWNFGDGTVDTTSQASQPSHTYTTPGTYPVTLTVRDAENESATVTQDITVLAPPAKDEPKVARVSVKLAPKGRRLVTARAEVAVLDATGKPAKKALVTAVWSGPISLAKWGTTRSNGTAAFTTPALMARGCYRLTVTSVKIGATSYAPPPSAFGEVCR